MWLWLLARWLVGCWLLVVVGVSRFKWLWCLKRVISGDPSWMQAGAGRRVDLMRERKKKKWLETKSRLALQILLAQPVGSGLSSIRSHLILSRVTCSPACAQCGSPCKLSIPHLQVSCLPAATATLSKEMDVPGSLVQTVACVHQGKSAAFSFDDDITRQLNRVRPEHPISHGSQRRRN